MEVSFFCSDVQTEAAEDVTDEPQENQTCGDNYSQGYEGAEMILLSFFVSKNISNCVQIQGLLCESSKIAVMDDLRIKEI